MSPAAGTPPVFAELAEAKYVSLTTFRRDGTPVATPVWIAPDGDRLVVWTATTSYKVARVRRDPAVTMAVCTARGEVTGPQHAGTAEVLAPADTPGVRRAIARKYGVIGWVGVTASRWFRGADATIGIACRPDAG